MKKILFIIVLLLLTTACFAGQINIIMKDGSIKNGELLGSDEEAYYIKNVNNKAETILRANIKKVFDTVDGAVAQTTEIKEIVKTKKAEEIVVAAVPYKLLEKGTDKIEPDYFKKTGNNYMLFDVDIAALDFAFLGDAFKKKYDIQSGMHMNYNAGIGLLFRPLDWIATGAYMSVDFPFFSDNNGAEKEVANMSFMKAGWILRWIPYSEGDDFSQNIMYFDFRAGVKTCANGGQLFDSTLNGKGIAINAMEYRILFGVSPGIKIGYIFCPATYTSDGITGNVDLSGPFLSVTIVI